ncbi:Holliday junction resolvase RuvX [Derxia gummosa]|uniref:Putative pre-16S rRNA nuclease n=1 Tax=Derxia gummosa DSM 723 TaxID=1121388 RepID=A0A8B6X1R6_9BURK|nr:Holliday junction resolvase RuvX [Derxia gummosa]
MPDAPAEVVLGFDVGKRRIGVAVGNTLMRQATPLEVIEVQSNDQVFARVAALVAEWGAARFVVGLPRQQDGADNQGTPVARKFGNRLTGRFNKPVAWVDEAYSSVEAEARHRDDRASGRTDGFGGYGKIAARKSSGGRAHGAVLDHHAAAIILQQHFDESPTAASP